MVMGGGRTKTALLGWVDGYTIYSTHSCNMGGQPSRGPFEEKTASLQSTPRLQRQDISLAQGRSFLMAYHFHYLNQLLIGRSKKEFNSQLAQSIVYFFAYLMAEVFLSFKSIQFILLSTLYLPYFIGNNIMSQQICLCNFLPIGGLDVLSGIMGKGQWEQPTLPPLLCGGFLKGSSVQVETRPSNSRGVLWPHLRGLYIQSVCVCTFITDVRVGGRAFCSMQNLCIGSWSPNKLNLLLVFCSFLARQYPTPQGVPPNASLHHNTQFGTTGVRNTSLWLKEDLEFSSHFICKQRTLSSSLPTISYFSKLH